MVYESADICHCPQGTRTPFTTALTHECARTEQEELTMHITPAESSSNYSSATAAATPQREPTFQLDALQPGKNLHLQSDDFPALGQGTELRPQHSISITPL